MFRNRSNPEICYVMAYDYSREDVSTNISCAELRRSQSLIRESLPANIPHSLWKTMDYLCVGYVGFLDDGSIRMDIGDLPKTRGWRKIERMSTDLNFDHPFETRVLERPGKFSKTALITNPGKDEFIYIEAPFEAPFWLLPRTSKVLVAGFTKPEDWAAMLKRNRGDDQNN